MKLGGFDNECDGRLTLSLETGWELRDLRPVSRTGKWPEEPDIEKSCSWAPVVGGPADSSRLADSCISYRAWVLMCLKFIKMVSMKIKFKFNFVYFFISNCHTIRLKFIEMVSMKIEFVFFISNFYEFTYNVDSTFRVFQWKSSWLCLFWVPKCLITKEHFFSLLF